MQNQPWYKNVKLSHFRFDFAFTESPGGTSDMSGFRRSGFANALFFVYTSVSSLGVVQLLSGLFLEMYFPLMLCREVLFALLMLSSPPGWR